MREDAAFVTVLISTHNRAETLRQTVATLFTPLNLSRTDWELVVVDNGSADHTAVVCEELQAAYPHYFRYVTELRRGRCSGLNAGIAVARGEIIAITDDDVLIDSEWLPTIRKTLQNGDYIGLGGKIVPKWHCPKPKWLTTRGPYKLLDVTGEYDLGERQRDISMSTVPFGANMAFRKTAFERYGLFRTDLGAGTSITGGDTEFCRRLLQAGERLVYTPQAVVHHIVEEQQVEKETFRRRYVGFGRFSMRMQGAPPGAVRYFGVPRYLVRSLLEDALRWTFAINPQRRVYYGFHVWQDLGEIQEAREQFRNRVPRQA